MKISKEEYAELIGYREQRNMLIREMRDRVRSSGDWISFAGLGIIFNIDVPVKENASADEDVSDDVQLPV